MTQTEAQRVVLVVDGWQPLALNALERMNYRARHSYRSTWMRAVWSHWHNAGRPSFDHPTITIRCYFAVKRQRDPDNASAGVAKVVLDGLKHNAFADDNAGNVDLQPVQLLIDRENPRVEIELEEASDDR